MYREILILIMLIGFNAFFAASEIALISLNDNKIRLMAAKGDKKGIQIQNLLREPSKFLATIQIGITLAGFFASAFAAERFSGRLVELIQLTGTTISPALLKNISVILITITLSYFTLVLGELVPKRLAMKKAEEISMRVVGPLNLLSIITSPFVKLLTLSTDLIVKLVGVDPYQDDERVTEEEIRMMVDMGQEKGTIDQDEKEMINNIFEFDNKVVTDIMTHRTDVISIPVEADFKETMSLIIDERFTRFPIYDGDIDDIIGVLHVKDLLKYIDADDKEKANFKLVDIMREAYYVPSSKRTDNLFTEMQATKNHIAIIIDEYGGTSGIVTIEDLMEEIVGNIFDEYDEEEKHFEKQDENTYIVKGVAGLDVVEDLFHIKLPVEEYDILSGFIIGQLGRIPEDGDEPELEFNGLIFKVQEVEDKRILNVKVCRSM